MTAEFHDTTPESITFVEDLFYKLEAHAEKEGGPAWRERRQKQILTTKAIHFYVQPNAEAQLAEYFEIADAEGKTEKELGDDETLAKLEECRVLDTQFEAYRNIYEGDDRDISTHYTVTLIAGTEVLNDTELPEDIQTRIDTELDISEKRFVDKIRRGESNESEDDFNASIQLIKTHTFVMKERQKSLNYSVTEAYEGHDFVVHVSTYEPEETDGQPDPPKASNDNDAFASLFNDIINSQDMDDISPDIPKNIRAAQVLAILSLMKFGESQNEQEQKTIEDLTA